MRIIRIFSNYANFGSWKLGGKKWKIIFTSVLKDAKSSIFLLEKDFDRMSQKNPFNFCGEWIYS